MEREWTRPIRQKQRQVSKGELACSSRISKAIVKVINARRNEFEMKQSRIPRLVGIESTNQHKETLYLGVRHDLCIS